MALTTNGIYFYGATPGDFKRGVTVAGDFGIPESHVLQSFTLAYALVKSGKAMVIAIGGPAANALKYNACGWAHYGDPGFTASENYTNVLPPAGTFMNANGETGPDSLQQAWNYTYYALNDTCQNECVTVTINPPANSCEGTNPAWETTAHFCETHATTYCPGGKGCTPICNTSTSVQQVATGVGWSPKWLAKSTIDIMRKLGAESSRMDVFDQFMAPAAMIEQGCFESPNGCYQVGNSYTDLCTSPVTSEGYGVLQETFDGSVFYHAESAYYTVGTVSSVAQESFFPFGVPTKGEHCAACSLVGDPGFAFAVFYWWAYSEASNHTACEIVNIYDGGYGQSAQQYAYAVGITPCATSSVCGVSEGTCSVID